MFILLMLFGFLLQVFVATFIGVSIGWLFTTKNPTKKEYWLLAKTYVYVWLHPIKTIKMLRE